LVDQIPTAASWNFDTWLEGTNILVEPGPGGPEVMTFTANAALTAGQWTAFATGTVVGIPADTTTTAAGVAVESAASGAHVPILLHGIVRGITASGSFSPGNRLVTAGAPAGAVKYASAPSAETMIGYAITAATTTGQLVIVHAGI